MSLVRGGIRLWVRWGYAVDTIVILKAVAATPVTANTPDLTDLQINYLALAGTALEETGSEPPDSRFSPYKPPSMENSGKL